MNRSPQATARPANDPALSLRRRQTFRARWTALLLSCVATAGYAQRVPTNDPPQFGPYNGSFMAGGLGLRTPITNLRDTVLLPDSPWTMYCWFRASEAVNGRVLLAGAGDVTSEYPRYLAIAPGRVSLWMGEGNELSGAALAKPGEWHLVAASFDGQGFHLYGDGVAVAAGTLTLGTSSPVLQLAPPALTPGQAGHFGGQIATFTLLRRALSDREVQQLAKTPPNFGLITFDEGSKPWQVQARGWVGYRGPQDPSGMPTSRAPLGTPVALKRPGKEPSLTASGPGMWTLSGGWTLREAPKISMTAEQISAPSPAGPSSSEKKGEDWMRATVPGTVLTSMIDDGLYPDSDFGLNNLAIPETLNKQDYWYRNTFALPAAMRTALETGSGTGSSAAGARHVQLALEGINYKAEIWLNGTHLGMMKGAFRRGNFDVTGVLRPGAENVLAVKISPPPHPGIPNEQSILGGAGENGGEMELDGPTFLATEGWDWIPAIRDRNSGLWQPVTLSITGDVRLGDTQIVSTFKNHDTAQAAITVRVPVTNLADKPVQATVHASFDAVEVGKQVTLPPGKSVVELSPAEFPQLNLAHPRLWWPNGYGKPELYTAKVEVRTGTGVSDTKSVRFGVREISYELSLLDSAGHLRRVEFTPASATGARLPIVDVSHTGMRVIPSADAAALKIPENHRDEYQYQTAVSSLAAGADHSPAIGDIPDGGPAPYLVFRVNGVRIAARGGNWGMDDSRKRVSREHLEPYFRLHRDAHLNLIRNWVGQNTEETFYDLADEYGLLIWNDFWESTQNYNIEAEDPDLFLANAEDTIEHFRNHPSIALWCGRNEGVPQPILNMGLEKLVRTLDGTRFYSPSSNQVNLQLSGPYSYQDPKLYYTALNRGFSVETGTPSMSTLESFESTTPKEDQWPMDDVWAYHDWHATGNGRVEPFMNEIEAEFGAPTSLPDFERKAQMLNYIDHRAIFEGMNANLFTPNSGRMLWMTQPAWPSTMWQILSADYDTQASFYGTKKACEPLHVQLNLGNDEVDVVDTTAEPHAGLTASAKVYSLAGALLSQTDAKADISANAVKHLLRLDLAPSLAKGMVIVVLQLTDASGAVVSRNLYWLGADAAKYRELTRLTAIKLGVTSSVAKAGEETKITVMLTNPGKEVSLANKLTLLGAEGKRVLPAYLSDNYVSLLPGESQPVEITLPAGTQTNHLQLALRGWNAVPQTVPVR